jgi:hypothetical protein
MAQQIPLPTLVPGIALPPVPKQPPTDDDVEHALNYLNDVQRAFNCRQATYPELQSAYSYFAEIIDGPGPIRKGPPGVTNYIMAPIMELLAETQKNVTRLMNNTAIHLNRQLNDGSWTPFAVVTFPDGSNPTTPPHNLPHLSNSDAITNLSDAESLAYYNGYYPSSVAPSPAECRTQIRYTIGYSAL